MAHDITKDVIGCRELEIQKVNISTEPAEFFGTITEAKHIVNKEYVDDEISGITHPIENGTAQGQLGFWDSALGKWVHSETSEMFWDDVNKRFGIGIATPLAQVHLLTDDGIIKFGTGVFTSKTEFTDTGIELGGSGRLRSGLFTEVNGSVLSYGINNPQIGGRDTSELGGIFRLDARGGREQFIVIGYKPGSDSDFERFAVSLSKGGIDIYHGDTSVAPAIRMRADNNHAYGFDFDIEKETIGRFDFYRVVNSVRTLVYSVLRSNGYFGISTTTPQARFHNVGTTRLGDQATNYVEVSATGDQVFVGGAGLCFGEIYHHDGGVDTILAAQDTWYQMLIFSVNGESNNTSPDHTNDHITITKAGRYLVTYHLSTRSAAANKYEIGIHKNNGATNFLNSHVHRVTSVAGRVNSASATAILDLAVNDTIELWIRRTDGGAVSKTLTTETVAMSVTQIGG